MKLFIPLSWTLAEAGSTFRTAQNPCGRLCPHLPSVGPSWGPGAAHSLTVCPFSISRLLGAMLASAHTVPSSHWDPCCPPSPAWKEWPGRPRLGGPPSATRHVRASGIGPVEHKSQGVVQPAFRPGQELHRHLLGGSCTGADGSCTGW